MHNLDAALFDRTDFLPRHEGPNVLPHDILFHILHSLAIYQNDVVIIDAKSGYVATHQQFLSDIVACRNALRETLTPETIRALQKEYEVSILILSSGYEFIVSFFAILAIGAIAVPLSLKISRKEMSYFTKTAYAQAILCNDKFTSMADEMKQESKLGPQFKIVPSAQFCMAPIIDPSSFTFSSGRVLDQNKPAFVVFTSGSTGPPKGAAFRRYNTYLSTMGVIRKNGISKGFKTVQFLPTHHATGLMVNTMPTILGGGLLEFNQGDFDPASVWDRFRRGDITSFSAVPTMFVLLLKHWEEIISKLEPVERELYQVAISKVREFHCATSPLPISVSKKWIEITRGVPILERYGGTEFGSVYATFPKTIVPLGSVGIKVAGLESKLSHDDEGEVLVRSPFLFSKYINDVEATEEVFDKHGYFTTGDIARREGDHYFIVGRASVDVLKSGGYKISALDIEQEVLQHPQVAEAIVVGVGDEVYGQRIAAAVVLKDPSGHLTLEQLRLYLKTRLSSYKMPTLLRVVPELRKTTTLKVPKLLLRKELFETNHPDIQKWVGKESRL